MATLDEGACLLPHAVWWLKADGVDVLPGLGESVRKEWSGDVDLGYGHVKDMHDAYLKRLEFVKQIGLVSSLEQSKEDLKHFEFEIEEDLTFLVFICNCNKVHSDCYQYTVALSQANDDYSTKLASGRATNQALFSLGWKVDELSRLAELERNVHVRSKTILDCLSRADCDLIQENIPRQLTDRRSDDLSFIEGVTRSRWVVATHLFVFMISPEDQQQKPYALPVQCVPYSGMPEHVIRALANKLIQEMIARGMKVAGDRASIYI